MTKLKIRYGSEYITVDVEDALALAIYETERMERLTERRETRRHQSLERSIERGFEPEDSSADVAAIVTEREERRSLYKAMTKLSPEQRRLLKLIYSDGVSETELAKILGVSRQAICGRLKRIYIKLRKNFED